jgi:hypothetical protein
MKQSGEIIVAVFKKGDLKFNIVRAICLQSAPGEMKF